MSLCQCGLNKRIKTTQTQFTSSATQAMAPRAPTALPLTNFINKFKAPPPLCENLYMPLAGTKNKAQNTRQNVIQ